MKGWRDVYDASQNRKDANTMYGALQKGRLRGQLLNGGLEKL